MDKLRVFEAFAGVGSQRMALRNANIEHEVVGLAEWDKNAIKSYQAIHGKETTRNKAKDMSEDKIDSYLFKLGISDNGKDPMSKEKIKRMNVDEKRDLINHIADNKNFVSVVNVKPEMIPDHDLFTYSFPCQDISVAGKQGGFGKDSGTRSGLLWECQKIIDEKRPKYLLLENVKNLVKGKHIDGFNKWLEWLEEQGYTNYWDILNSKDFGVPQNRERVFVVSILGNHKPFDFPKGENSTSKIADIILDDVDKKYNNSKALRRVRKKNYIQYDNSGKGHDSQACRLYYLDGVMGTLPHSNSGDKTQVCSLKKDDNGVEYEWARRLNPQECWRMMGFKDEDYLEAEKVNSAIQLYRQAGNSIVVPVLEGIFLNILKTNEA